MSKAIACVTGATAGFGRAIAQRLAAAGHPLVLVGRRSERLAELQAGLSVPVHRMALDVRDRAQVAGMFASLPEPFADIAILVNNAGLALGTLPADQADLEDWERMVDTNVKGLMYCTHALLPGMVARGEGHIVNIGSIAGSHAYPGGNAYGGTKAFVSQFSDNLRADLLGKRVRVTNIEPGMAETEFSLVRYHGDAEKAASVYAGIQPLTAEDVAETVMWSLRQPPHVNINRIELMPIMQAAGGLAVKRT